MNFDGVESIGQAFADEIFRVFAKANPRFHLLYVKANSDVKRVIDAAKADNPAAPPTDLSLL